MWIEYESLCNNVLAVFPSLGNIVPIKKQAIILLYPLHSTNMAVAIISDSTQKNSVFLKCLRCRFRLFSHWDKCRLRTTTATRSSRQLNPFPTLSPIFDFCPENMLTTHKRKAQLMSFTRDEQTARRPTAEVESL